MNAFLLHSAEPVLVDTGTGVLAPDFVDALADRVKLPELKWIWLTHEDRDHAGALERLLELAPKATVLGTFLTFGRAAPAGAPPFDRTRIVNPGDDVHVGDRVLRAVRPPLYDSPGTLGFLDRSTGAYFSSDCFGAPLPADLVAGPDTDHIDPDELRSAQVAWAGTDSPWVAHADGTKLRDQIEAVRGLDPPCCSRHTCLRSGAVSTTAWTRFWPPVRPSRSRRRLMTRSPRCSTNSAPTNTNHRRGPPHDHHRTALPIRRTIQPRRPDRPCRRGLPARRTLRRHPHRR
ncbi:MAG: MBL fold metallo-hydrolase [Mycobacterium sp.]